MGKYKLIIIKTHMPGSQFHRCLYQSNSTAMHSQQTVKGFDRKKNTLPDTGVGKAPLPICQLGTATCEALGSISAPVAQQMAMSQPGPTEKSSEDLGGAKHEESHVTVLRTVTGLCPCGAATSSTPGLRHRLPLLWYRTPNGHRRQLRGEQTVGGRLSLRHCSSSQPQWQVSAGTRLLPALASPSSLQREGARTCPALHSFC